MKPEDIMGKKVKDTDSRYRGDKGVVSDRQDCKSGKTYMIVQFGEDTIHGDGEYRKYSPSKFGGFGKRFKIIK